MSESGEPQPMMQHGTPMPHGSDAIAIVNLVMNQIDGVEHRIKEKIDGNADAAMRRWRTHDDEHHDLTVSVRDLVAWQAAHDEKRRADKMVFDARIGPARSVYRFLVDDKRWMIVFTYIGVQFIDDAIRAAQALGLLN